MTVKVNCRGVRYHLAKNTPFTMVREPSTESRKLRAKIRSALFFLDGYAIREQAGIPGSSLALLADGIDADVSFPTRDGRPLSFNASHREKRAPLKDGGETHAYAMHTGRTYAEDEAAAIVAELLWHKRTRKARGEEPAWVLVRSSDGAEKGVALMLYKVKRAALAAFLFEIADQAEDALDEERARSTPPDSRSKPIYTLVPRSHPIRHATRKT